MNYIRCKKIVRNYSDVLLQYVHLVYLLMKILRCKILQNYSLFYTYKIMAEKNKIE